MLPSPSRKLNLICLDVFLLILLLVAPTWEVPPDHSRPAFSPAAPPAPFLDLPIAYDDFEEAASGSGPGRILAWFDHAWPFATHPLSCAAIPAMEEGYFHDDRLTFYTGLTGKRPAGPCDCRPGQTCSDGHDGLDFRPAAARPELVFAAAAGRVLRTIESCQASADCSRLGNQVWIDHGNCYATVYAHLDRLDPALRPGLPVAARQPLGWMGSTGLEPALPGGRRLHFGVFLDPSCDGNWDDQVAVDPFGWLSPYRDPWLAGFSQTLWLHPLAMQAEIGPGGGALESPSGRHSAVFPAGALTEAVAITLAANPPVPPPPPNLRLTGRSLLVQVLGPAGVGLTAFRQPVPLTLAYTEADFANLDQRSASIQRWDEEASAWTPLVTALNTLAHRASALAYQPGSYALLAPLACPSDPAEIDDTPSAATPLDTSGGLWQHTISVPQDQDWYRFTARPGVGYLARLQNLSAGLDLTLELYASDGLTLLAEAGGDPAGADEALAWHSPSAGVAYLRLFPPASGPSGCSVTYRLSLQESPLHRLYLPSVSR